MQEWLALTYVLGATFVAGQIFEYAELAHEGLTFTNSTYGSVFYLATGFHGLHVIGGLIAFLFVLARSFTTYSFGHREATTAVVVSYYWHFVDVVWILLFAHHLPPEVEGREPPPIPRQSLAPTYETRGNP